MRAGGWQGEPVKTVVIDGLRILVDGHHRLAVARRVGIDVPYIVVDPRPVIGKGAWKSIDDILNDVATVGSDLLR
jgi:hypothetical protein